MGKGINKIIKAKHRFTMRSFLLILTVFLVVQLASAKSSNTCSAECNACIGTECHDYSCKRVTCWVACTIYNANGCTLPCVACDYVKSSRFLVAEDTSSDSDLDDLINQYEPVVADLKKKAQV